MISTDLAVQIEAGLTFNLQFLPYQQFRIMADIIATESHTEFLRGARTAYAKLNSFDKTAHQTSIAKLTHEQRSLVIAAQNLTMTSAAKRLAYFGEGDGRCPFCSAANSGILHEAWECNAFKEVQQEQDLFLDALTTANTPHHVLLGIPEQLSLDYSDRILPSSPGRAVDLISQPELACSSTMGNDAINKLAEWASQSSSTTATTLAYRLMSHALPPLRLHANPVQGHPPAEPNTFTDGSVKHPGTEFAQAAFGIIFPHREDTDRNESEKDIAEQVYLGECCNGAGLAVAGSLFGLFPSSTRIELAGAIGALLQPRPVHIAADNASVINKANVVLHRNGPGRRPWGLQADGDLWETFHALVQQRGAHSIALTWTKGHATYDHLIRQVTSSRNAVFNAYADAAADQGHRRDTVRVVNEVLNYLAAKHRRLTDIMRAIVRRVARVAAAVNKRLEEQTASRAKNVFIDTPGVPVYRDQACASHLVFEALPPLSDDANVAFREAQIRAFWTRLLIHPLPNTADESGTTWLQLFAVYSLRGGGNVFQEGSCKEHLRATHSERFKRFQRESRSLFRFADMATTPLIRPMLHRTSTNLQPLAPYGLIGRFSMLPFTLALGEEVAAQLHAALCAYSARVPSVAKVPKRLRSARFKAPRFAPWDHLACKAPLVDAATRAVRKKVHDMQCDSTDTNKSSMKLKEAFLLQCPRCKATADARHKNLYKHSKCCGIRCASCCATITSSKWHCVHGTAWIACHMCRSTGFLCKKTCFKGTLRP